MFLLRLPSLLPLLLNFQAPCPASAILFFPLINKRNQVLTITVGFFYGVGFGMSTRRDPLGSLVVSTLARSLVFKYFCVDFPIFLTLKFRWVL